MITLWVVRKEFGELPLDYDQRTELSRDQMINLRISHKKVYTKDFYSSEYAIRISA